MKVLKIVMMNKNEIKIDFEELLKIMEAIESGNSCRVKQGIFNPKVYSEITKDDKRELEKEVDTQGHYTGKYTAQPLEDIFEGIEALTKLKAEEIKRLN